MEKKYAYIGDREYFEELKKNLIVNYYSNALELNEDIISFNPDVILLMVNHITEGNNRSSYFGLVETLPALRFAYRIKIPIILLGFESSQALNKKFEINSFLSGEMVVDAYIQLPCNEKDIKQKFNSITTEIKYQKYLPFLMKSNFLGKLKHKNFNNNDPNLQEIIDFIEGINSNLKQGKSESPILKNKCENEVSNFHPTVKLLIIDDSEDFSYKLSKEFNKIKSLFESKLSIKIDIISTQYVESINGRKGVFDILKADGDIQVVLLDWQLEVPGNKSTETLYQKGIKEDLVRKILDFRPDLHIYTMTAFSDSAKEISKMQENTISFFFKEELLGDAQSAMDGIFLKHLKHKMTAPFWEAYQNYIEKATDTWHPPGHSRGKSFFNSPYLREFYNYWGRNVFTGDLSFGVNDIGFLDESNGSIGAAQKVTAQTFGAKHTFFITNGTSTSNKVVMQSVLKPGDKVIIDRNCHKSNHYGFLLANAHPVYLDTQYIEKYSFFAAPSIKEILKKVNQNRDAKLLILTGSNYEGVVINTKRIVDRIENLKTYLKRKGVEIKIKIFIDEAWFGYSAFHPEMRPYSAVYGGADYVTQSSHKVLSAFSQASVIHINDPDFNENEDYFREIYQIYLSTSPQYQIISSLDICSLQMRMEGFKILDSLIKLSHTFCDEIRSFENCQIEVVDEKALIEACPDWDKNKLYKDPLKVLLDVSQLKYSPEDICLFLNKEAGIEIERRTKSTILVIFSIGSDRSMVYRLINALKKINDGNCDIPKKNKLNLALDYPTENKLLLLPSTAFYSHRKLIKVEDAVGAISASLVTPYPPGIPLLVFGQLIEKAHTDKIIELNDDPNTQDIHGLKDKKTDKNIYVVTVYKNSIVNDDKCFEWDEKSKTVRVDLENEDIKNKITQLINRENNKQEPYKLLHKSKQK